jgi:hypothetical protein
MTKSEHKKKECRTHNKSFSVFFNKNLTWLKKEILDVLKNGIFWDVAPCRSHVNQRFGGTYRLHLQGRKIRERGTSVKGG